ncbi:MAG: hypothetical protein ACRCYO_16860, partial [Bacteroidia bacterium]
MNTHYKLLEFSHDQETEFLVHANRCIDRVFQAQQAAIFKSSNSIHPDHKLHFLVVVDDAHTCGVMALYRNTSLDKNDTRYLMLGNYCCIDDSTAANYLLSRAEAIAKELNCTHLLGPMNGTTWDAYRFCIGIASPDYFSEQPCMAWFSEQWKANGFQIRENYVTTVDRKLHCDAPEILEREQSLQIQGIRMRTIAGENYVSELPRIFQFCTQTFRANVLYSGISEARFFEKHAGLNAYMHSETTLIAENSSGEIVGLIFCFADHFSTTKKRLIIKTVARHPAPGYRGLPQVMGNFATRFAKQHQFDA